MSPTPLHKKEIIVFSSLLLNIPPSSQKDGERMISLSSGFNPPHNPE